MYARRVRRPCLMFVSAIVILFSAPGVPAVEADRPHGPTPAFAPDRLIVKCKPGAAAAIRAAGFRVRGTGRPGLDALNNTFSVRKIRPLHRACYGKAGQVIPAAALLRENFKRFPRRSVRARPGGTVPALENTFILELAPGADVLQAVRAYHGHAVDVEYAEPDYELRAALTPNDPFYASAGTWGQSYDDLWGLKADKLNCGPAWDLNAGEGVVVAVIDTGVDRTHDDLAANMWTNPGEVLNNSDDDGNGLIDDIYGWDYNQGDNDPSDGHGHGTHCAGTIAAVGNNLVGIAGVAFGARIMGLKGLSDGGSGYSSDLAACVMYAANKGADVLSNSYSGYGQSQTMADAFDYAHSAGCVSVAAAGNNNADLAAYHPANIACVIAVAATDYADNKASFSNYGWDLDVAAPGVDILSLRAFGTSMGSTVGDHYTRASGTSMACPHAAGVCALILAATPGLDTDTVRTVLRATSDDIGTPGVDQYFGYGRINAQRAVDFDVSGICFASIDEPTPGALSPGSEAIAVTGSAYGDAFYHYYLEYLDRAAPDTWIPIYDSAVPVVQDLLGTWDVSGLADGDYVLNLRVLNTDGETFVSSVGVAINNVHFSDPPDGHICNNHDTIELAGSALGYGFDHYGIEWAADDSSPAWSSWGVTLVDGGMTAKWQEPLGWLDVSVIAESGPFLLRLTAFYDGGRTEAAVLSINVDTTLKAGWPVLVEAIDDPYSYHKPYVNMATAAGGDNVLVVTSGDSVYLYDAAGTLLANWVITGNDVYYPLAVVDLDGDGEDELVTNMRLAGGYDGAFDAYHLDGTPVAGWPAIVTLPGGGFYGVECSPPAVGDLDNDGSPDMVFNAFNRNYNSTNNLYLYVIGADGTVADGWPIDLRTDLPSSQTLNRTSPSLADLNGDGKLEVIFGTQKLGLHVFSHDGKLLTGWPQAVADDMTVSPAVGDIDGDGQDEIAIGTYTNGSVFVFDAAGNLEAGWPVVVDRRRINEIALADLDKDGDLEVIFSAEYALPDGFEAWEKLYVYHHNGTPADGWPQSLAAGMKHSVPVVGDIDGDGEFEIVACKEWHGIAAFEASGELIWQKDLVKNSKGANRMLLADLDADGLLEFITGNDMGYVLVWGTGGAAAGTAYAWPSYKHDGRFTGRQLSIGLPPVLDPVGDKAVAEGSTLAFTVSGSDPDGDDLAFSAAPLPAGATFTDSGAGYGSFSWTPDFDQAGAHDVTFAVTDGLLQDAETITITVGNVNRPPQLDPVDDKTISEGGTLTFTVTGSDPDGDALTFSAAPLPPGATLTGQGLFAWTPGLDQAGAYPITFSVTDGVAHDVDGMTITVEDVPEPAVFVAAIDMSVGRSKGRTYAIADIRVVNGNGDPVQGAEVSVDWSGDVSGSDMAVTEAGGYARVESAALKGSATFVVTVTDVVKADTVYDPSLNVETSDAINSDGTTPGNPPPTAVAQASPLSGTAPLAVTFDGRASSDDGTIVSWEWDFGDGSGGSGDSVLHTYDEAGTYSAVLTVTDDGGGTGTDSVTISVVPDGARTIFVFDLTMSVYTVRRKSGARVTVAVHDTTGAVVAGAAVSGAWSGQVTGSSSGVTDAGGQAVLESPVTPKTGTITFTITDISAPGCIYDPVFDNENTDSVSVP